MSFKDVKELRTQGKLNEALKLALVELAIDSENIWNKRALAWVYYDFLKINSEYSKLNDFNRYWDNLMGIDLSEDNIQILHESVALQLGKVIFSVFRESELPTNVLDELFEKAKLLSIERPSKANSFLIKAFLKGSTTWPNIHLVLDYFGFEGFSDSDYLSEEFNGKAITSTVEKFYNLTCKFFLDATKKLPANHSNLVDQINVFLPILSKQIIRNPEYQFLPYFKAKLMLAAGQREGVLEAFLPFAKRKRNEFWVWEVMAEVFDEHSDERFACLCKALSLNSPEAYVVGLRSDFAKLLITRDLKIVQINFICIIAAYLHLFASWDLICTICILHGLSAYSMVLCIIFPPFWVFAFSCIPFCCKFTLFSLQKHTSSDSSAHLLYCPTYNMPKVLNPTVLSKNLVELNFGVICLKPSNWFVSSAPSVPK